MALEGYELRRLSEVLEETPPVKAQKQIEEKFPAAWGIWCRWQWMVTLTGMLDDIVVVVHGPLGCEASGRVFHGIHFEEHFGLPFLHIPTSNMGNKQVILGGEDELQETLRRADREYHPPLIIVHSNCCAGLNMDDIPQAIDAVKDEVKAKIVFIPSEGFSCTWTGDVAELNVPLYTQIMDPPKKVDPKAVNIIGLYKDMFSGPGMPERKRWDPVYPTNAHELARTVEGIGLKMHRALFGGDYEYFRTAPEAAVNAIDCTCWGYPLAKEMQKRFGTPYMKHGKPIGVETTIRWINELAEFMGVRDEAARFINREYDVIKETWEKARQMAKGKVALIDGVRMVQAAATRPLAQARFAMELGMTPYIFEMHPLAVKAKEETMRYFISDGVDPLILFGPYAEQKPLSAIQMAELINVDPHDVVYMHNDVFAYARADAWDAANVPIVDNIGQPFRRTKCRPRDVGFRGTEGMARDVIAAVMAAERKDDPRRRPTLYGRLRGSKSFDFELQG